MTTFKDELEKILKELAFGRFEIAWDTSESKGVIMVDKATQSIINLVDKELPEDIRETGDYGDATYGEGYNQAIDDMRAKLKGVSNV